MAKRASDLLGRMRQNPIGDWTIRDVCRQYGILCEPARGGEGFAMTQLTYPLVIEILSPEDGGGFLALVPDLPGCMSDGTSPEEAVANVQDAIDTWIEAANDLGHAIPAPSRHLVLDAAE